jgi:hypothetical protein
MYKTQKSGKRDSTAHKITAISIDTFNFSELSLLYSDYIKYTAFNHSINYLFKVSFDPGNLS